MDEIIKWCIFILFFPGAQPEQATLLGERGDERGGGSHGGRRYLGLAPSLGGSVTVKADKAGALQGTRLDGR